MKNNKTKKQISTKSKFLLNSLRTLGIIFVLFLSLFAFDTGSITGTIIHLIPALILLAATSLSWISSRYSGLVFITFGLISIFFFNTCRDIEIFLILTAPPIVIGILFYIAFYLGVEKNIVKQKK